MQRCTSSSASLSSHVNEDYSGALARFGAYGFGVACMPFYKNPPNLTADELLTWRDSFQRDAMNRSRLQIPVSFRAELLHSGAIPGDVVFPMPALLGSAWNITLARAVASASAAAARRGGVDYGFAPVLQCATDARWGRFAESFSEDPTLVTELGVAATCGFQGDPTSSSSSSRTAPLGSSASPAGTLVQDSTHKLPVQAKHYALYGGIAHDTLASNPQQQQQTSHSQSRHTSRRAPCTHLVHTATFSLLTLARAPHWWLVTGDAWAFARSLRLSIGRWQRCTTCTCVPGVRLCSVLADVR